MAHLGRNLQGALLLDSMWALATALDAHARLRRPGLLVTVVLVVVVVVVGLVTGLVDARGGRARMEFCFP